ncbi:MAG: dihydroorotase [Deltaproteobacteria bacterium]|jgi:dihydroorotase
MGTWIKGGVLVDPLREVSEECDLIIERGKVERILPRGELKDAGPRLKIIDASGKLIFPGLIDMHVHLREPGHEYKETIFTGSLAGVAGGFTGLACMPNTEPVNDSPWVTRFILERARKADLLSVYPMAAVTVGQRGDRLTDFSELRRAGAVGVSDDGRPVVDPEIMRMALESARDYGLRLVSHCEDPGLSAGGVMHEGYVSKQMGVKGIPAASEEVMVQRDISLAKLTGCPFHVAHVSTAGSVELIKRAKEEGVPVTAETAPHYFTLDHTAVIGYNTNAKMNPPLRSSEDMEAVRKGLSEGVIDAIATDHAPHSLLEKAVPFDKAAFGIIGLETAVPLTLALVRGGVLSMPSAIRKLSLNPATILGVNGGLVAEGKSADLAIVDPEREFVLEASHIHSKSKNSPFIGKRLKGKNTLTMRGGHIVWERHTAYSGR